MSLYFWVRDLLSRTALGPALRLILFPLTAVAWLYGGVLLLRRWAYRRGLVRAYHPGVPVLSVGNLTVGGTGKTPCVEAVCRILLAEGIRPAILSRGYGREGSQEWAVVSDGESLLLDFRNAGDEPVLLARALPGVPVLVGADRRITAREAVRRWGAQALVLDDGFQHLRLARDLDIVTIDLRNPLGNGHCLPRGLLREPPRALGDADVILLTRAGPGDRSRIDSLRTPLGKLSAGAPILAASHSPMSLTDLSRGTRRAVGDLQDLKILVFAGIGNPQAFFQDVDGLGARVLEAVPFPDHHPYSRADLDKLLEWARLMNADALLTAEKDGVRLAPLLPAEVPILALGVELELLEGKELFRERVLAAARRA